MAKTEIQRLIERNTNVTRMTSGAATKNSKTIRRVGNRKSRGGKGK